MTTNKKKIERLQGIIYYVDEIKKRLSPHQKGALVFAGGIETIAEELINELEQEKTTLEGSVTNLSHILKNVETKSV